MARFINISFPFENSAQGFFLGLNSRGKDAIKSDLMHLILTQKGERYYMPDFGTDLYKHIFEQNEPISEQNIRTTITDAVSKYLPKLTINEVKVEASSEDPEYRLNLSIRFTITEDAFTESDIIQIKL